GLIKTDNKNKEIIKPLLRGKDIRKYSHEFSNTWIITTFPALNINIEHYPAIKNYLLTFQKALEQTGQKGSRKKTNHKWFEFQDATKYYNEFNQEKIVFSKASKEQSFSLDNSKALTLNTTYIATGDNLKFILSVLNSKLAKYIFLIFLQSGGIQGEITLQAIEKLSIPKIPNKQQEPFINLVNTIIDAKEKIVKYNKHMDDMSAIEKIELKEEIEKLESLVEVSVATIDQMVYELYGLSDDEVALVEGRES
ncbi:MAG TPA: class I SAM-dependent DNA methyltransferase, partial [Sulfurovum sp.]|nr:class I SAM-dependent DNA methyltransferase [Sulfurovum sp.]